MSECVYMHWTRVVGNQTFGILLLVRKLYETYTLYQEHSQLLPVSATIYREMSAAVCAKFQVLQSCTTELSWQHMGDQTTFELV